MFPRCFNVKREAQYKCVLSNDHVLVLMHDGDLSEDNMSLW